MRTAIVALALAALVALPALSPAVEAHAAPDPLGNAVHVLADEGEDTFYWYDGYDLYNLFAREAYVQALDEPGIVFRFALYGGFAPASDAQELAIDLHAISPEGEQTFTITTSDDEEWTGDMEVLVADVNEDDLPWTGVTARLQAFVSYEQLGVAPGGSLEDVRMVSRADDDVRDVAPGGFMIPHTQGQGEVPAESERLVDSLELEGPHGYVDVGTTTTEDGFLVSVENALDNGQHVTVDLDAPEGWNASINGSSQASLEQGDAASFAVDVTVQPEATQPLRVEVVTDLGGQQERFVGVNGTQLATALDAQSVEVEPASEETNESPALSAWLAVAVVASIALLAERRKL